MILQQTGKAEEAAEQFAKSRAAAVVEWKKTAEFYPEQVKVRFNLAVALERGGALEEARCAIPERRWRWTRRTQRPISTWVSMLARIGKVDQAIRSLCEIASSRLWRQRTPPMATWERRSFRRAASIRPSRSAGKPCRIDTRYADAHSSLATALALTGRLDEGISHLQMAIAIVPDSLEFRYNLGRLFAAKRSFAEAIPQFEAAAKLSGGRDLRTLEMLAAMYSEVGRFSDAVETSRRALVIATQRNDARLANELKARIAFYETEDPRWPEVMKTSDTAITD